MTALLLSIFYLLFSVLAWRRLNWVVLLVIATLPSYLIRFHVGPIPMTLLEGMILIVVAVWLLRQLRARGLELRAFETLRSTLYALRWPLALFLIAATAAMFVAPDWRAAAGIWKAYFIEPVLFFIILLDLLIHHPNLLNRRQIIAALSVSALLLSLYAIYQRFTGFGIPAPWDAELRVTGIFPYPNALGLFLAPLVPLFVAQIISYTQKSQFLLTTYYLLLTTFVLFAIAFAQSTGALVGVGVSLFAMIIIILSFPRKRESSLDPRSESGMTRNARLPRSLWSLAMTIVIAIIIFIILRSPLRSELLLRDWSGHVRRTQWSETIVMLKDHPLLGAGLSGYPEALKPYHKATYIEIFQYPHNIVLNFWSEIGLLGLIAFAWLIILFFRNSPPLRLRGGGGSYEPIAIGAIAAMVTLLIHGLVDVPYLKNDLAILFWIVYALGIANNKNSYATSNQTLQTH